MTLPLNSIALALGFQHGNRGGGVKLLEHRTPSDLQQNVSTTVRKQSDLDSLSFHTHVRVNEEYFPWQKFLNVPNMLVSHFIRQTA